MFGPAFEKWPIGRYWRGDPCKAAPASEQCRNFTADLRLQSYGLNAYTSDTVEVVAKPLMGIAVIAAIAWWLSR